MNANQAALSSGLLLFLVFSGAACGGVVRGEGTQLDPDAGAIDQSANDGGLGRDSPSNSGASDGGLPSDARSDGATSVGAAQDGGVLYGPVPPSATYKRIFVTEEQYQGNFGGTQGADAICAQVASHHQLGGQWIAWVSSSLVDEPQARFKQTTLPYVNLMGEILALGWNDLVSNGMKARPRDENGSPATFGDYVWTATNQAGYGVVGVSCNGFTDNGPSDFGAVGDFTSGNHWSLSEAAQDNDGGLGLGCQYTAHIYCFEQ